jgi:hypothetical protein
MSKIFFTVSSICFHTILIKIKLKIIDKNLSASSCFSCCIGSVWRRTKTFLVIFFNLYVIFWNKFHKKEWKRLKVNIIPTKSCGTQLTQLGQLDDHLQDQKKWEKREKLKTRETRRPAHIGRSAYARAASTAGSPSRRCPSGRRWCPRQTPMLVCKLYIYLEKRNSDPFFPFF